jgi:hypothetical protein
MIGMTFSTQCGDLSGDLNMTARAYIPLNTLPPPVSILSQLVRIGGHHKRLSLVSRNIAVYSVPLFATAQWQAGIQP